LVSHFIEEQASKQASKQEEEERGDPTTTTQRTLPHLYFEVVSIARVFFLGKIVRLGLNTNINWRKEEKKDTITTQGRGRMARWMLCRRRFIGCVDSVGSIIHSLIHSFIHSFVHSSIHR
jgi:hypothetical protein